MVPLAGALLAFAALSGRAAAAPSVTATVDRDHVSVGEQVTLTITVSDNQGHDVRPPSIASLPGMDVDGPLGPSTSQEFRMGGGQTMRRVTTSYTYYLQARQSGECSIPPLGVIVDGQRHETSPIRITIGGPSKGEGEGQAPLEVRLELSSSSAYQGQGVLVEYLLYENGRAQIGERQISEEPTFSGVWAETLLDARRRQPQQREETVNGIPYVVTPIMRVALFPTRAGTIRIPSLAISAVVAVPTGTRNIFGEQVYRQRSVTVRSPERTMEVRPLPANPPQGFGGAVGTFALTSRVDRSEVSQGDPITWTLELRGEGNIKAAGNLTVPPLTDFRAYDPQVTTSIDSTGRHGGRKLFERVLIPLHSGRAEVPAASFVFFDPEAGRYRTVSAATHPIIVHPRADSARGPITLGMTQAEIREVGRDIRFIRPDMAKLRDQRRHLWGARWYWALQSTPLVAVLAALGVRWRRRRLGEDPARGRASEARREVRRRLKAARRRMKAGDHFGAIAAIRNAVAELIAGHAGVSAAGLTADQIRGILAAHGVSDELAARTLALLERCDRVRYAAGQSADGADDLYRTCDEVIGELVRGFRAGRARP